MTKLQEIQKVVKDYRYVRKGFKDPYKMLVAADKCIDELLQLLKRCDKEIKDLLSWSNKSTTPYTIQHQASELLKELEGLK